MKVSFFRIADNAREYNENNIGYIRQRLRKIRYYEVKEISILKDKDKTIPLDTDYYYGKLFVQFMNQQRDEEFEKINKLNNPPEEQKIIEEPPKIVDTPKVTEKFEPVS